MSFHENLILHVQNYKELYDLSDKYYSNQQRKEEIWKEISVQIGETSDLPEETWRKLRDNHRKAKKLRKTKSGQGAQNIKPIKFEKGLTFLNPHLQQPQELQTSNLSVPSTDGQTDEHEADNSTQQLTEKFSEAATPDSVKNSDSVKSVSTASMSRLNSRINRKRENVQKSPMQEYLEFKRQQQVSQQAHSHPLDVFFSLMAATVKTFPARVQLNIKQKVFQLVTDTEATLMNSTLPGNIIPGPFKPAVQAKTAAPSHGFYTGQTMSSVTLFQQQNVNAGRFIYDGQITNENQLLNLDGYHQTSVQSYYHTAAPT